MNPIAHKLVMTVLTPIRPLHMADLAAQARQDGDEVRARQERALRSMIAYCWRHVPYYREKWSPFIRSPEEIRTIDDLSRLPVLTKDELRTHLHDLITTVPSDRGEEARSGGSTGRPTIYRRTRHDQELSWGQLYTGWSWAGYRMGDPFLVVGGESVGVGRGDARNVRDRLINRWVSSGSNLSADRARELARSEAFSRITLIYGYPNSIRELGELLADCGARPPRLRGIVCTAEVMTPELQERISQLFGGVTVLNQYGLNDGGLLAVESPARDGLHVFPDRAVLEIADDDARPIRELGRVGRALATSITNHALPLIRYETGDQLHWKSFAASEASGITWPRIGPPDGRTGDVIHLATGRSIAMPGLTLVMRWLDGLEQYQFIQTGPQDVTVVLDWHPDTAWPEQRVMEYLQRKIAPEINWSLRWGKPELTGNGKLLVVRNDWLRSLGLSRPPLSVAENDYRSRIQPESA